MLAELHNYRNYQVIDDTIQEMDDGSVRIYGFTAFNPEQTERLIVEITEQGGNVHVTRVC